jgi:putative ABC transport system permease protein
MLTNLLRRVAHLIGIRRLDADLDDEIESHRAMAQDHLEARGLSPADAAQASRRALGNVALAREDARQVWVWRWIDSTWQDIRIGTRGLQRNPAFTSVALLTLALGIGITTTMFTVVEAVLLRPLPYQAPDRLAMLWTDDVKRGVREVPTSYLTFADWRSQSRRFSDMAIFQGEPVIISGPNGNERVLAEIVAANLFSVLGVVPASGRVFSADEEDRAEQVVVISHALWQRQFGGSPSAVGSTLTIRAPRTGDQHFRILGVMPAGFYFPSKDVQLWRPTLSAFVGKSPKWKYEERYRFIVNDWGVIGRLAPAATVDEAREEMTAIGRQLAVAHQSFRAPVEFAGFAVNVVPLLDQLTGTTLQRALWMLLGAVSVVLLIACVNVANLLLARGAARGREFAIRSALGAGRLRLIRQSLTEAAGLGIAAAFLGLLLAAAGVRALAVYAPAGVYPTASTSYTLTDSVRAPVTSAQPGIPRLDELSIDRRIVTFAVGVSLLAVLLFGLAPARRLSRSRPADAFLKGGRSIAGSRSLSRTRHALVMIECALAVVLLVGAGLLIRSVAKLDRVDPGFSTHGVLLVRVTVAPSAEMSPLENTNRRRLFYEGVRERLSGLPTVESVGLITDFLSVGAFSYPVTIPGRASPAGGETQSASVDGGFFRTIGVPLLRGRLFSDLDTQSAIRDNARTLEELKGAKLFGPAVVNQAFADRFFPGENPIGQRYGIGDPPKISWHEIVGVVGNMRRARLTEPAVPEMFAPYIGQTSELAVRTSSDPLASAAAIREAIRSVDPNGIVMTVTTLERKVAELDATRQLQARLLVLFAGLSLLLAAIGVYGVVRYSVEQRTQEIGVRIALGARPRDVLALVLRHGLLAPLAGLAIGLAGALGLSRVLVHALFETSPTDPATLGIVVLSLVTAAVLACSVPARRAARIDPVVALRQE